MKKDAHLRKRPSQRSYISGEITLRYSLDVLYTISNTKEFGDAVPNSSERFSNSRDLEPHRGRSSRGGRVDMGNARSIPTSTTHTDENTILTMQGAV